MLFFKKLQCNIFLCSLSLLLVASGNSAFGQIAPKKEAISAAEQHKPLIITTIKPLAIIAKSAVGENAQVETLQTLAQSAHDVTLTVSSLKRVEQAALIIWVGGGFEGRLGKSLELQPVDKQLLLTEMEFLPAGPPGREKHHQDDHHGEIDLGFDPHIWLNPINANILANSIQQHLGLPLSPVMSARLFEQLKLQLAPYKSRSFLTHHDAYGHFIEAFGLSDGLSIRDPSGASQGARSQYLLRRQVKEAGISCIFIEPQYADRDARVFASELELPMVVLDPQGIEQQLTTDSYSQFITKMAGQFKACFN